MDAIDVGGRTIAYRRSGRGPSVVLLHGGLSDSREWRLQTDALASEFDVVAWDAPGCGGSPDPPADFGMAGYADAVAGLVRGLGLDRPHLVGISFGGGLAIAVYERHRELVRSLVLASAYAGWAGSLPPDEISARFARTLTEIEQPPDQWIASYLPSFFAGPVPPQVREEVIATMRDVRPSGTRPMIEAFASVDLRHVLATIDVPTLLLHGEADVRAPRAVADALHAAIPGAELVTLPGMGHSINLEAPDEFNAEVRHFLRTIH
jgi:pimeloyl-ACP methyl ester carboxylesterase